MNDQNQLTEEVSKIYDALKNKISILEPSDTTTEVHQLLMQSRELAIKLVTENETLRALKLKQSISNSKTVEEILTTFQSEAPGTIVKILDKDASRDNMLAVSNIDRIDIIEINDFNGAKVTTVLLHKNMTVDWLPNSQVKL